MPLTGTIVSVNTLLTEAPEKINESPLEDGWIFRCEVAGDDQYNELMDADAYQEFVGSL